VKILIPTYLERERIAEMLAELAPHAAGHEIYASCTKASASVNRNLCLDQLAVGETAIMLDDDIRGFYPHWIEHLLHGLTLPHAVAVSARLLNRDGTFGPTCSKRMRAFPPEILIEKGRSCVMPTAAIAFVHRGHRFDERFRGSGFEDNDWFFQYLHADPQAEFVQSNRCPLVHLNQMKEQKGENWEFNKSLMFQKWGV
jgi:hypothetical protein